MSLEHCTSTFICRVNDAYIMSHTIYDLVNDPIYRKLEIKHGKAMGMPLASRHILPGYWFTVFVAPQESIRNTMDAVKRTGRDGENSVVNSAHSIGESPSHVMLNNTMETFYLEYEKLISALDKFNAGNLIDTFPQQNTFKRIMQSISCGNYSFDDNNDLTCTFIDSDDLCGYRFEATVNVAEFTHVAIDFSKQLVELVRPVVNELNRKDGNKIANLLICKMER